MKPYLLAGAAAIAVALGIYVYTGSSATNTAADAPAEGAVLVAVTMPETLSTEAQIGQRAFSAVCAECHGDNAAGRQGFGPPLVHEIYEPSHHGDMAFQLAVQQGVRAHHWRFGNMPAQEGLTRADVDGIVTYVRELQRANGIN